jgi:hypothetical protein
MNAMDIWQVSIGARLGPSRTSNLEILKNIIKIYYENDQKKHAVVLDCSQT